MPTTTIQYVLFQKLCKKIKYLPKNPPNGGIPAIENKIITKVHYIHNYFVQNH